MTPDCSVYKLESGNAYIWTVVDFNLPLELYRSMFCHCMCEKFDLSDQVHYCSLSLFVCRTMVLYLGNLAVLTTSLLLKASRDQQCVRIC